MENLVKSGYIRIVGEKTNYISYKEFYTYEEAYIRRLRERMQNNTLQMYCACWRKILWN
ncbi:MAG: hypothetical protein IJN92_10075 [Lachnospiraceae bacterium]|nr:hypothetical protein [Lachnospiraceae bacterium]